MKYISRWKDFREKIKDKEIQEKAKKEVKHAFLYLILSTIGTIVDCCVFLSLTGLGLPVIPSNIISDTSGLVTSFSLNVKKNFKNKDYIKTRFISYVTISLVGMALSTGMLYFFIEGLGIPKFYSKIMQLTIMAIPLYVANRSLTFRDFSKGKK